MIQSLPSSPPSKAQTDLSSPRPILRCLAVAALALSAALGGRAALAPDVPVRGWTILSDSEEGGKKVIAAAPGYGINQLGLSQKIISRLNDLLDEKKRGLVNRLADTARAAGIPEILVWDNPIYWVNYYPEKFRTGPNGTIDLDNPEFWEWFKADYRHLLDLAPSVNALVLQFMESQGQIVDQYSKKWTTDAEKLAAVVNAIADVAIGERHMNIYARIYPNDRPDNPHILEIVKLLQPKVRLIIKETPLDYLLTVPSCAFIGALPRQTTVEFVPAAEFGGQGIVCDTWVEDTLDRWRDFSHRPYVIGYAARTDRFLESRLIGQPGEIDLYALKRATEDPEITAEEVYDEFITAHYGAAAVPEVKAAFKNGFEYATSLFYTLGTVLGDHSQLEFDYTPPYMEMCSGRWFNPPVVRVAHGVNREFHIWRDVMNRIAPPYVKDPRYKLDTIRSVELRAGAIGLPATSKEANQRALYMPTDALAKRQWLQPGEAMDEEYLRYIETEKANAVRVAEDSVRHIENARPVLKPADYELLHHYFNRSLLTARLWHGTTAAYFGFRVWSRGPEFQTPYVTATVQKGLAEIREVAPLMRDYPVKPPTAMYDWVGEAGRAEKYFKWIAVDGWPRESQPGIPNANGGMKFPFKGL